MATTQIRGGTGGQIKAGTVSKADTDTTLIAADGTRAFSGDQSHGGFKITNLGTPSASTDAATKGYVDGVATGLDVKASVRAATTANITLSGAQTIDGVSVIANDRVLVKNQSSGAANGIYVAAAAAWTRATDADVSAEVTTGMFTFVEEGTTNGGTGWVLTTANPIVLGTTVLVFAQFSGSGTYSAGNGLSLTGTTFAVLPDGTTLSVSGSGTKVAAAGITATELAASVAGNGLSGGAGTALAVNVAAAGGIQITSDALEIKLDGSSLSLSSSGIKVNTAKFITRETPTGSVNGSNTAFTLANTPVVGTEQVFLNGLLQEPGAGNDYTISGGTITYLTAPATGDRLRVTYIIA